MKHWLDNVKIVNVRLYRILKNVTFRIDSGLKIMRFNYFIIKIF